MLLSTVKATIWSPTIVKNVSMDGLLITQESVFCIKSNVKLTRLSFKEFVYKNQIIVSKLIKSVCVLSATLDLHLSKDCAFLDRNVSRIRY